ncbi:MAG: PAS domain S-box protein, partial [Deltaproteobacteria bacterium]|nr:PAS domain S-box protein [Deltaproteobacteria bacterium]
EGLRGSELCVWIVSEPLSPQDALDSLKRAMPELAGYIERGSLKILRHDEWYLEDGSFSGERVLNGWSGLIDKAERSGLEGMRVTGNVTWLGGDLWDAFVEYERRVQHLMRKSRMLAICTYTLQSLSPADITEVVSSHAAALIKKDGKWRATRRAGLADDDQELREKERRCTLITELTSELVFRLEIEPSGDLGLEWITSGFSEASGYGPAEISTLGKLQSIIHPGCRAAFKGSLQKVLAGTQADTEVQYLTNYGQLRWIRLHMVPERHIGTRIIKGIIGRGKDITERKKAEERVIESERKYRGLYESISDGVMKIGADGQITDANKALASMLGWSMEELGKLSYMELTPPELRPMEEEILKTQVFSRGSCEYEKELLTKDGRRLPASVSAWLLKDAEGNVSGFWAFVKDLTETKDAERKILNSENLFNALTLSLPGTFYVIDKNGQMLKWNRTLEDITEYTRAEIEKMHPVDFFEASERRLIREKIENAFTLGAAEVEAGLVTRDGRKIPFHFRAVVVKIDGEPFLIGTGTDISRWKKAEAALRSVQAQLEANVSERTREILEVNRRLKKSEERFRVLVETTSDWVWEIDTNGVYTYVSPKVREILGYGPDEILGKTPFDLMPPGEAEKIGAVFKKIVALKKPFALLENRNLHKDGREVILETSGAPILDPAGNLLGYRGMDRDITGRKLEEAERGRIQQQLIQSQKMEAIGILAGGIAHDFNNLMVIIRINNSLALKKTGSDSAEISAYLEQINAASERAENLTRQLLIFSRRQPTETRALDLNRKVRNTLGMLKRLIGENIVISMELSADIGMIRADKGNIEQIIMNLVINAKDAMHSGGKITLKTAMVDVGGSSRAIAEGRHVKLTVEDTGTGMDGQVIRHIFEPFFSTKGPRGTGLGLAVVHGIVRDLGGWIDVESRPGEGTRFEIYLPSLEADKKEDIKENRPVEELSGRGEKVLIVEDEKLLRKSVAVVLSKNGYSVLEAGCALEAKNLFEKEHGQISLVFSDMVLQDRDGIQLIEDLKSFNKEFKVLITSGYLDVESQWPAIREKGYRFLQKPYEIPDLLKSVREALEKESSTGGF